MIRERRAAIETDVRAINALHQAHIEIGDDTRSAAEIARSHGLAIDPNFARRAGDIALISSVIECPGDRCGRILVRYGQEVGVSVHKGLSACAIKELVSTAEAVHVIEPCNHHGGTPYRENLQHLGYTRSNE